MSADAKILVIDDFATMRKIVTTMLQKLQYKNISEADSGKSGWEMLQKDSFDLVISDCNMPEMTGIELLKKIREDSRLSKQKFIMVSAEADIELMKSSKQLNIDGYILKPFKIETLEAKLKTVLP
ncbi:response regulator [Legionella dresdenensis]|uniref:Response regulator n=1 Tax=Legionella dresdenensis TaxID=450200 RepID=A0ABV8CH12_9GAMM